MKKTINPACHLDLEAISCQLKVRKTHLPEEVQRPFHLMIIDLKLYLDGVVPWMLSIQACHQDRAA
jgi:hypothetical protein